MYDSSIMTPVGFYSQYRALVMANTEKTLDTIKWNGQTLTANKKFGPTTEDLILLVVLAMLYQRLPAHVKSH